MLVPTVTTVVVMSLLPVLATVLGGFVRMSRATLARRSGGRLPVRAALDVGGWARLTGG